MLIVDAGNSRIKVAIVNDEKISQFEVFSEANLVNFEFFLNQFNYSKSLISSVKSDSETQLLKSKLKNCLDLKNAFIPLEIDYKTKNTLGSDRIANAVAAKFKAQKGALVIDIGTCIKFDFVNTKGVYEGGSISPGIQLRYKSLNDYTGALPLLKETSKINFLGKSTHECIQSGVLNGIQGELNYLIDCYTQNNKDLTIFVTGGDALCFDYSPKKNIFVVENLTLLGLSYILKANE